MNKALLLGLCILIVFQAATAAEVSLLSETAAVGRLIGDTPSEIKQQLSEDQSLDLQHAFYAHAPYGNVERDKERILKDIFPSNTFPMSLFVRDYMKWDTVEKEFQKLNKQSLIIIEDKGGIKNNQVYGEQWPPGTNDFLPSQTQTWLPTLNRYDSLIVYDGHYAGLSLPNVKSFTKELVPEATIIAPNAMISREFVRSFICNLAQSDVKTVGDAYTSARNNYHYGYSGVQQEPIGLILSSYNLYGNPARALNIPETDFEDIKRSCKGYLDALEQKTATKLTTTSVANGYQKAFTVNLGSPETIDEEGDYHTLKTEKTILEPIPGELVLPKATNTIEFPHNTLITKTEFSFSNPSPYTIPDLPSYAHGSLTQRTCTEQTRPATIDFTQTITEEKQVIVATIYPVEIVNCETGEVKLYKDVTYSISYVPYSAVNIQEVKTPETIPPESPVNIDITLESLTTGAFPGEIRIVQNDQELARKPSAQLISLPITAPALEGIYNYKVEFIENNEVKTFSTKFLQVEAVAAKIFQNPTKLELENKLTNEVEVFIDYQLKQNDEIKDQGSKKITLTANEKKESNFQDLVEGQELIVYLASDYGRRTLRTAKGIIVEEPLLEFPSGEQPPTTTDPPPPPPPDIKPFGSAELKDGLKGGTKVPMTEGATLDPPFSYISNIPEGSEYRWFVDGVYSTNTKEYAFTAPSEKVGREVDVRVDIIKPNGEKVANHWIVQVQKAPPPCGNNICEAGETYITCSQDCHQCESNEKCDSNQQCQNYVCVDLPPPPPPPPPLDCIPQPEIQDGRDNDCDGLKDEVCELGQTQQCPDKKGVCKGNPGTQLCNQQGQWSDCDGGTQPEEESCDGLDNNCNGEIDDGVGGVKKIYYLDKDGDGYGREADYDNGQGGIGPGPVESCAPPQDKDWIGRPYAFRGGDCVDEREADKKINPGAIEVCDTIDNDCDGLLNEDEFGNDYGLSRAVYQDRDEDTYGDKNDKGTQACKEKPLNPREADNNLDCNDYKLEINPSAKEKIGDKIDNDCDGIIDAFCEEGKTHSCGTANNIGVCKQGTQTCTKGQWGFCTGEIKPQTEIPNDRLDNDCDRITDEECEDAATQSCGSNTGECRPGKQTCIAGFWGVCESAVIPQTEILTDKRDNDCDGLIDEVCTPPIAKTCGQSIAGECRYGMQACQDNGQWGQCIGAINPTTEICDSKDNDCDGKTDEDSVCRFNPADLDDSGCVDFTDYRFFIQAYDMKDIYADLDKNNIIEFADFVKFSQSFGKCKQ